MNLQGVLANIASLHTVEVTTEVWKTRGLRILEHLLVACPTGRTRTHTHTPLRRGLRRGFSEELCRRFSEGFLEDVLLWVSKVLRRVLRRGFSEGAFQEALKRQTHTALCISSRGSRPESL